MVLYTCSRVVGDDSTAATRHKDWQLFTAPGKPNRSWGCFNVCPLNARWQDMYAAANARIVRDLPVSGVYLDTTAEALRCFNTAHPHSANPADDVVSMLTKVRKEVKAVNKDAVIMTEYIGSDYFAQFIDSCWVQTFANPHAHAFNNFDLDFSRFVYPYVKYAEWGQTPRTFEVDSRRAFFNGVGSTRGDLKADQKIRFADMTNTQQEMFDALATHDPVPFVPSASEFVFINFFPGKKQTAWTYYNKAGVLKNAPLMKVSPEFSNKRFVELLTDREIPAVNGMLSLDMAELEVGMIAAFDRLLEVENRNGEIVVTGRNIPADSRLFCIPAGKRDSRDNRVEVSIKDGKAVVPAGITGKGGRVIFKLISNHALLDETVISL